MEVERPRLHLVTGADGTGDSGSGTTAGGPERRREIDAHPALEDAGGAAGEGRGPLALILRRVRLSGGEVTYRGGLYLQLRASGRLDTLLLPEPGTFSADGRLSLRNGRLEETPVTGALASLLSRPALRRPELGDWSVPIRLREAVGAAPGPRGEEKEKEPARELEERARGLLHRLLAPPRPDTVPPDTSDAKAPRGTDAELFIPLY